MNLFFKGGCQVLSFVRRYRGRVIEAGVKMLLLLLFVLMVCVSVSASVNVHCEDLSMLQDCAVVYRYVSTQSGVYTIYPNATPIKVYCDMDTDGAWTVIQRRMDRHVNFHRPWAQYKDGFGNPAGEFWLGLDHMHLLTKHHRYHLRLDLEDFEGNTTFALYSHFSVGSEATDYKLQVSGFKEGGAGDSMTHRNGHKFSTFDKNQAQWNRTCANQYHGAFWQDHHSCHYNNPNGFYLWQNQIFSISMKIRRDY